MATEEREAVVPLAARKRPIRPNNGTASPVCKKKVKSPEGHDPHGLPCQDAAYHLLMCSEQLCADLDSVAEDAGVVIAGNHHHHDDDDGHGHADDDGDGDDGDNDRVVGWVADHFRVQDTSSTCTEDGNSNTRSSPPSSAASRSLVVPSNPVDAGCQRQRVQTSTRQEPEGPGNGFAIFVAKEDDHIWNAEELKMETIKILLQREATRMRLSGRSAYARHREQIISWFLRVGRLLRLSTEVKHLALYFFDRYVDEARSLFLGDKLELLILSCIQLAAKSIESDHRIPKLRELNALLDKPRNPREFIQFERTLLRFFKWNVSVPVLHTFIGYFREFLTADVRYGHTHDNLVELTSYFEYVSLKFLSLQVVPPSQLAAGILVAARFLCQVEPVWPPALGTLAGFHPAPHVRLAEKLLSCLEKENDSYSISIRQLYRRQRQNTSMATMAVIDDGVCRIQVTGWQNLPPWSEPTTSGL